LTGILPSPGPNGHRAGIGYPGQVESTGSTPPPDSAAQLGPAAQDVAQNGAQDAKDSAEATRSGRLFRYLAVYTVLRLGLLVVLTAVLAFFMPLIVALLFAIIVQLPLAWLLFTGPRSRVNDAIAVSTARRRQERERLQSALTGEPAVADVPTAARQQPTPGVATDGDPAG